VTNDPPSLSDHLYIRFNCNNIKYDCRKTNWNVFSNIILNEIDSLYSLPTTDAEEIDKAVDALTALIQKATNESTPVSRGSPKKYSRWWTSELSELRKGYRRLLRIFKSCNSLENEVNLRNAKKNYKLGILNAKKSDWNKFCADKPNLDPWNTIHKICKNSNAIVQPLHVTKDDGSKTNSVTEAGEVLLNKWFLKDDHSTDSNYHGEVRAELRDF